MYKRQDHIRAFLYGQPARRKTGRVNKGEHMIHVNESAENYLETILILSKKHPVEMCIRDSNYTVNVLSFSTIFDKF